MRIATRRIGPAYPPYFVADPGANHDRQLSRMLALVDWSADIGADALKPQLFRAETIVSRRGFEEAGKIGHQAKWEGGVYEAYEAAATPLDWMPTLAERCRLRGIALIATPYDLEVVDEADPFVSAWKIGSGDVTYHELIRKVASRGKPVLLATGASTADEVSKAVGAYLDGAPLGEYGRGLVLMQCNTNYTGERGNVRYANLRVLDHWANRYHALRGLSDHTPGAVVVNAAIAKGACVIEKHLTDDRTRTGPDHAFAMEPEEWRTMLSEAYDTWSTLGDGQKKVEANEKESRIVQRRALRWARDLPRGHVVEDADLVALRPCPKEGVPPSLIGQIRGRTLNRDVGRDGLVRREEFA